jgi:hypothetical protein
MRVHYETRAILRHGSSYILGVSGQVLQSDGSARDAEKLGKADHPYIQIVQFVNVRDN